MDLNKNINPKYLKRFLLAFFIILVLFVVGKIVNNEYQINKIRSEHAKIIDQIVADLKLPTNYTLTSKSLTPYKSEVGGCFTDFPCLSNITTAKFSYSLTDRTREQVNIEIKHKLAVPNANNEKLFDQHLNNVISDKYSGNFDMTLSPYELKASEQVVNDNCYKISDNGMQNDCRYEVYKNKTVDRMDLTIRIHR